MVGRALKLKRSLTRSLPQDDPVLVATVERALKPYEKILSPSMLEHFRREVLLQLSAHPHAVALVKQIKKPDRLPGEAGPPGVGATGLGMLAASGFVGTSRWIQLQQGRSRRRWGSAARRRDDLADP